MQKRNILRYLAVIGNARKVSQPVKKLGLPIFTKKRKKKKEPTSEIPSECLSQVRAEKKVTFHFPCYFLGQKGGMDFRFHKNGEWISNGKKRGN